MMNVSPCHNFASLNRRTLPTTNGQCPSLFPAHAKYRNVFDAFHVDYLDIILIQFILKFFKVKFAPSGVIGKGPDKNIS